MDRIQRRNLQLPRAARFLLEKGHVFKTQSDTEVIVHLYEELGPQCVEKLRGMFAFALWDENNKTLVLARDRVGIKPLYYSLTEKAIVFASEIKAILADPAISRDLAPEIIDRFLTFLYVPGRRNASARDSEACARPLSGGEKRRRGSSVLLGSSFLRKPAHFPSSKDAEQELLRSVGRIGRTAHDCRCPGRRTAERRSRLDRGTELRRGKNGQGNQQLYGGVLGSRRVPTKDLMPSWHRTLSEAIITT